MAVTALIILLATIGVTGRLVLAVHRALIGHRTWLWRVTMAVAGLGYGLPLRGHLIGNALIVIGVSALASMIARASHRRRTLPALSRRQAEAPPLSRETTEELERLDTVSLTLTTAHDSSVAMVDHESPAFGNGIGVAVAPRPCRRRRR